MVQVKLETIMEVQKHVSDNEISWAGGVHHSVHS